MSYKKIWAKRIVTDQWWNGYRERIQFSKTGWILCETRNDSTNHIRITFVDGGRRNFFKPNFEIRKYSYRFERYRKRLVDYALRVSKKRRK